MARFAKLLATLVPMLLVLTLTYSSINGFSDEQKAPDFSLKSLDGLDITFSDYSGKVLFLNFWASWCPPCLHEIPGFVEVYEKYKDQGLVILGVSVDQGGPEVVKDFAEKYKITYPLAMVNQQIIEDYRPGNSIPFTFVIDKQGKIRDKHLGYMDKNDMEKLFLELSK